MKSFAVMFLAAIAYTQAAEFEVHIKAETFRFAYGLHKTCSDPPKISLKSPSVGRDKKIPGTFINAKYDWGTQDFNIIGDFDDGVPAQEEIIASQDLELLCEGGFDVDDVQKQADGSHDVHVKTNSPRLAGFMHRACKGNVQLKKHGAVVASGAYRNDRYDFGAQSYTHLANYGTEIAVCDKAANPLCKSKEYDLVCPGGLPVYMIRKVAAGTGKVEAEMVKSEMGANNDLVDASPQGSGEVAAAVEPAAEVAQKLRHF